GTIFSPILGLRKLLLISGYVGLGMVTFGLILGIINTLREGKKKHAIAKIGWIVFGWGVVLTGLALMHHQHINPIHHVQGIFYVEFFSKFYHGNGKAFRPFGTSRKYTYDQYEIQTEKR